MKKYLFVFSFCLASLLGACGDDNKGKPDRPDVPEMAERTVLAYFIADNGGNELTRFVIDDFEEMLVGMKQVNSSVNNLLIYVETKYDVPHLIRLGHLKGKVVADTVKTYKEQNPLEIEVMTEVLGYVQDNYPAKSYGLIFASHGEGWMEASRPANRWIGDYRGTYMNISDLKEVLTSMPKLDFLFFDACFMQSIEVAYELREHADYFIGSPTEIPGPGAPYETLTAALFSGNPAFDIAREYFRCYEELYADGKGLSNDNWTAGVSVSVMDASKLSVLAEKTKPLISKYITDRREVNFSQIMCYDPGRSVKYYHDLEGLIAFLAEEQEYQDWKTVYDLVVSYYETTEKNYSMSGGMFSMEGSNGVSTYVPREKHSSANAYYRSLDWYTAAGWGTTGW